MQFDICIIDDEFIIAMDLKQHIKKLGFNPILFNGSEEELLKFIKEKTPHLVILDVKLRGEQNGYSLAKIILKEHRIPIIFITGTGSGEYKKTFLDNENVLFIKKPFDEHNLKEAVHKLLKTDKSAE